MSQADFDLASRRLAELQARYVELVREHVPDPREFYEAARQKFDDVPDLSGNTKLDYLCTPRPEFKAVQGIAGCTEWLDISIAFEAVAIMELLAGHTEEAEAADRLHRIAHQAAVGCAQLET